MSFKYISLYSALILISSAWGKVAIDDHKYNADYYNEIMIKDMAERTKITPSKIEIASKILTMGTKHSYIEKISNSFMEKLNNYPKEYKKFKDFRNAEINKINKLNQSQLKKILNLHTWRELTNMGNHVTDVALKILQNSDLTFQLKMLRPIEILVKEEKMAGHALASLADSITILQGQKQIYGTQTECINGFLQFSPVADLQNVDKKRKEIGLYYSFTKMKEILKQYKKKCSQ